MPGWVASRATVAGTRFTPVNAAKLYSSTGTGDASAIAVKCRTRTSLVICDLKNDGVLTRTASAPASAARRVAAIVASVDSRAVPTTKVRDDGITRRAV